MSYDVQLTINTGKGEWRVVDIGNYTSNVSGMWFDALGGQRLSALNGRKASDVIELLQTAIADMEARPEYYSMMNPSNGWGNYEGAVNYLKNILRECLEHPLTTLEIGC